jgi:hypothetical protein
MIVAKVMTPSEAETKRQRAVEFLHRMGKHDDAGRFGAMDAREYAEHKGATLTPNPLRSYRPMPRRTNSKAELKAELDEAKDYIEELEGKLDDIAGLASGEDDEDEDDDDADSDDEDLE